MLRLRREVSRTDDMKRTEKSGMSGLRWKSLSLMVRRMEEPVILAKGTEKQCFIDFGGFFL
jgi:hypothetical protein